MSEISIDEMVDVSLQTRELFESDIGYFTNSYIHSDIEQTFFVQDSISFIKKAATVKGLHLQNSPFGQAKLVTVLQGEIIDYIVDLRTSSSTYLHHAKITISQENKNIVFIPRGFAHGYITTNENTMISYKVDNHYSPEHERTINWQDSVLALEWPKFNEYFLSEKDKDAKTLKELEISTDE
jgi:dTDP-4-dehydrorhamnose 3,5-epimerase